MLVLSRKHKEETVVTIGNVRVVVTIVRVEGKVVKLGFTAPQGVHIVRGEIEGKAA